MNLKAARLLLVFAFRILNAFRIGFPVKFGFHFLFFRLIDNPDDMVAIDNKYKILPRLLQPFQPFAVFFPPPVLEVECLSFPRTGAVRRGLRPEGAFPAVRPVRHPHEVSAFELPDVDALVDSHLGCRAVGDELVCVRHGAWEHRRAQLVLAVAGELAQEVGVVNHRHEDVGDAGLLV